MEGYAGCKGLYNLPFLCPGFKIYCLANSSYQSSRQIIAPNLLIETRILSTRTDAIS
jgi:hypothetical protein